MIERTPEFLAAQDRVKVGHFTRQGFDIGGVVHVGANDGEEIPFYLALGSPKVIAFEPEYSSLSDLFNKFMNDPRVGISGYALSDCPRKGIMNVTRGTKGSSFLSEINSPYKASHLQDALMVRFDSLDIDLTEFGTLVVDVQGMEMQVLQGFGEELKKFSFLNIECSETPLFEGESPAQMIVWYLDEMGFQQDSPIVSHDDVMFIRKGLK